VSEIPKVSIVIAAYNALSDYKMCLSSMLAQTEKSVEIIWVDSASSDNSVSLIREEFPSVRVVELDYNAGYRGGTNVGCQHAKGEYIVVCNQDVEVAVDWIQELVHSIENAPTDVGIVAPLIMLYEQRDLVNEAGNTFHFSGLYGSRGLNEGRERFSKEEEIGTVSGCSFLIRRKVWEDLGGFSSDYDVYAPGFHAGVEDLDLCWRARLQGFRILINPRSLMYHKYIKKGWTGGRLNSLYFSYNLTAFRNFQLRSIVLLSPFLFLLFCCFWGAAFIDGLKTVGLLARTQIWFFQNLGEISKMRQKVQSVRKVPDLSILRVMSPTLKVTANSSVQKGFDLVCRGYFSLFRMVLGLVTPNRVRA
jgi:hypothetical protein